MRIPVLTILLLVMAVHAKASTVSVEADDSSGFSAFQSSDLTSGSVLLGTFQLANGTAMSDSAIQAFAMDFSGLMSRFTRYSTTEAHILQGSSNAGELSVTLNGNTATTPTLVGKQMYYVVVSGTDNSTVASSLATARQVGVYYVDQAFFAGTGRAGDWMFHDENDPDEQFITRVVDISDLTVGNLGSSLLPGGFSHVIIGSFGPDHSNAHPSALNFQLALIPEPSACVLAMFATIGLLARRPSRSISETYASN
jgi:hypothetical protein